MLEQRKHYCQKQKGQLQLQRLLRRLLQQRKAKNLNKKINNSGKDIVKWVTQSLQIQEKLEIIEREV